MFLNVIAIITLAATSLAGLRWGGLDERLAVAGFVLATFASRQLMQNQYGQPEFGIMLVDFALLIGLMILALRSDRFWPMWAAAFQLVGTTIHLASMTENGDFAKAYANALVFWSYPVMAALLIGTWREMRYHRN